MRLKRGYIGAHALLVANEIRLSLRQVVGVWEMPCTFPADIKTTMNVYGKAMAESMREANSEVVRLVIQLKSSDRTRGRAKESESKKVCIGVLP